MGSGWLKTWGQEVENLNRTTPHPSSRQSWRAPDGLAWESHWEHLVLTSEIPTKIGLEDHSRGKALLGGAGDKESCACAPVLLARQNCATRGVRGKADPARASRLVRSLSSVAGTSSLKSRACFVRPQGLR